jgi:hypothetical protein
MIKELVNVAHIFTGAESGAKLMDSLTHKQLDALIQHPWPEAKSDGETNQLESVIKNIQAQYKSDISETTDDNMKNSQHDEIKNLKSRTSKLGRVMEIAHRMKEMDIISFAQPEWGSEADEHETKVIQRVGFVFMAYHVEFWCSPI